MICYFSNKSSIITTFWKAPLYSISQAFSGHQHIVNNRPTWYHFSQQVLPMNNL